MSAKTAKDFQSLSVFAKNPIQKFERTPNTCHKIVFRKFPMYKAKQKRVKKVKNQNSVKVENISTHHRGENNVSGAAQVSFRAKFKATSNKLGQKRHCYRAPKTLCSTQCIYIYIYKGLISATKK